MDRASDDNVASHHVDPVPVPNPNPNPSLGPLLDIAVHDSLSSEDGSGLHTPTLSTPVSAYRSLPPIKPTVLPLLPPSDALLFDLNHPSFLSYHHPLLLYDDPLPSPHHYPYLIHGMTIPTTIPPDDNSSLPYDHHTTLQMPPSSHPSLPDPSPSDASRFPISPLSVLPSSRQDSIPVASTSSDHSPPLPPISSQRSSRGSSGMVIACKQCRARKIRCDSNRPVCHNCTKRCSSCEYDAAPKRRGPDKRPGTRQRTCKKKPADEVPAVAKRRKTGDSQERLGPAKLSLSGVAIPKVEEQPAHITHPITSPLLLHGHSPVTSSPAGLSLFPPPAAQATSSPIHTVAGPEKPWDSQVMKDAIDYPAYNHSPGGTYPTNDNSIPLNRQSFLTLASQPSMQYSRKDWWDNLLNNYTPNQIRSVSLQNIVNDLTFLFSSASHWLACFNVPILIRTICDPVDRDQLQPALILSSLALATLMRSSEIGLGEVGRERALNLRDAAQASMEASIHAQWIDPSLAQAALILSLFEASAHPKHTSARVASSLVYLDSTIRTLALTCLDANDRNTSVFLPKAVPTVPRDTHGTMSQCRCDGSPASNVGTMKGQPSLSSSRIFAPPWDPEWTTAEVRKEESRRLCWSALTLVAAHTAECAAAGKTPLDLQLIQPSNYAILFPGEALPKSNPVNIPHPPKESVWALNCRSMLLWNSCLHLNKEDAPDSEKADFAVQAWMEAHAIEDALNSHVCGGEQASLYVGRDYLLNTRMTITQEFRRYIPLPAFSGKNPFISKKMAEDWLKYQQSVAQKVKSTLHLLTEGQGKIFASRPFYVWWFMGQITISMALWQYDPSLKQALEICHEYLAPIDVLTYLWPCQVQRIRYMALRERIIEASVAAGMAPPSAPNFGLPSHPVA